MFGETDPTHHTYPSPIQKALARTLYQALIFLLLSPPWQARAKAHQADQAPA